MVFNCTAWPTTSHQLRVYFFSFLRKQKYIKKIHTEAWSQHWWKKPFRVQVKASCMFSKERYKMISRIFPQSLPYQRVQSSHLQTFFYFFLIHSEIIHLHFSTIISVRVSYSSLLLFLLFIFSSFLTLSSFIILHLIFVYFARLLFTFDVSIWLGWD
jgi:hypothetical protein